MFDDDIAAIQQQVASVLASKRVDIWRHVRSCVAVSCNVLEERIDPNVSLVLDLGADSVSIVGLTYCIERVLQVRISPDCIREIAQRGSTTLFEGEGRLSERETQRLRLLMPYLPEKRIHRELRDDEIPELFTPETYVWLVAFHLPAGLP